MTDRESLYLTLVVLHLMECIFWVHRGGWVFRTWLGRFWNYRDDSEFARNDYGGVHWAWPVPPLGEVYVCRGLPISCAPEGVLAFKAEGVNPSGRSIQGGRFLRWDQIKGVEVRGKKVFVEGEVFWACDTASLAVRLATFLKETAGLKPEEREARLRAVIRDQYDTTKLRTALEEVRAEKRVLNRLCPAQWAYLFAVVPFAVWRWGWIPALLGFIPLLYVFSGVIAWQFRKRHARLFPGGDEDRFKLTLIYALMPVASSRARDPLTRLALEAFHPMAGAAVLLAPGAFASAVPRLWRDLHFPQFPECPTTDPLAIRTERWYRDQCIEAFRSLVVANRLDPDPWLRAPMPSETVNTQYCPRCLGQFTKEASSCSECTGRPLKSIATALE